MQIYFSFFNKYVLHNTSSIYKLFLHFISRVVGFFCFCFFLHKDSLAFVIVKTKTDFSGNSFTE